ncbi:PIN domain-containing protein [Kribbella sandramycini]|uniref:Ribonuclease VapC n=1 Tax=Kribbella sandramycini TaxID=60450 RepID=A0A7Y4NZ76_9ACTN|nr:PIN domain-containing protein [Kribbella sandramycini]MBB6565029.1 putative nucleic acid-binding protein [Kribbella sandramycini]NOL41301.1 PIN domain-containing protein [Kribbella sandramycini]
MILIADTSGIIAAFDRNAPESADCRRLLQEAGTVVLSPLVLAEVDHLARVRLGSRARATILDLLHDQVAKLRFQIPDVGAETFGTALSVIRRYADLDLDLADAVSVCLAADYRTDAVLTLDRRDFRAVQPLTPHKAFRLLPDDL